MSTALDDARAALKERQGLGARYDAPGAPARELDWARAGHGLFRPILNDLPDDALDEPSAIIGFSRRRLIAQVGYQARLFSEIVAWARSGQTDPFPKEAAVSPDDLEFGITQPSRALRYLFETFCHSSERGMARPDRCRLGSVRDRYQRQIGQPPSNAAVEGKITLATCSRPQGRRTEGRSPLRAQMR